MAKVIQVKLRLDPTDPTDAQMLVEMRYDLRFRTDMGHLKAQSIRTTRTGVVVTAKADD